MNTPIALVTGGSRGIGRAIVARLVQDGYQVVNFSRRAPDQLLPGETFRSVDLGDAAATREAARELAAERPVLHLVNNAGMIQVANIEDVSEEDLLRTMALNVTAPVLLLQALLPGMRQAGYGRVVNIGSRAALGKGGRTVYGASKAGLAGMTRTWALELAADGITVNTVAPGPIATELFNQSNPPGQPKTLALEASIPVGRVGQPEEVAHSVALFLDRRAGFITGQLLYVCGGMSVGLAG
ncbi:short-chain dehydrogenase [Achromobacter marplatensis]|jgi:NAD(P)-dependent dehydrogenase (short-subunit alcohol dehydrogenase family)|uniref:NAD(P)-dependent dehydrogenase (Short-subunit alcohol dehydrogenase family) n=1 Tax=Achromobacter marplatensis TaxID=470868 RepID=J4J7V3_9BURK|nr:SDR family oxidoreductase [Achromobacter marplatensis]EJO31329.1 short chain dehydrogenase family protein 25 [Achromobacter marplatensis]MDH2054041.1 SDR family oxidoreductase [Achromobacter marplatensis]OWT69790.1 short-chain dehydrogenase [Achromobacter marplatensis]RBP23500.1 NAD(P)-dependent dehydrogenase (short-subunit alcohol dehydrogenase family) [Achromobacter marplatensis]CAB3631277.1 3-oxoacyl-[acyl-carrier-protein] reductase FabG [Achromobacter marplatensis]